MIHAEAGNVARSVADAKTATAKNRAVARDWKMERNGMPHLLWVTARHGEAQGFRPSGGRSPPSCMEPREPPKRHRKVSPGRPGGQGAARELPVARHRSRNTRNA